MSIDCVFRTEFLRQPLRTVNERRTAFLLRSIFAGPSLLLPRRSMNGWPLTSGVSKLPDRNHRIAIESDEQNMRR